jgi:drug/metabolite transporter (DMT)-like permease
MTASLTALVLLAALMHAGWNALVKSSSDRLIELTALNLVAGGLALIALPFVGLPGTEAIPYLVATMTVHSAYYVLLLRSYAGGGLSLVYPIARGSSPVVVAAASGFFVGEPLGSMQWLAVALIAASITSLAFSGGLRSLSSRAVLFSLATGLSIGAYTLIDGVGARVARTPLSYIAAIFVLNALPMLVAPVLFRRGVAVQRFRAQWKTAALGGVLSMAAYGLAIWAMTLGPLALVAAVRETSVVFAAIIGTTLLHEPFGRARVLASVGVALGIIVLRLAS